MAEGLARSEVVTADLFIFRAYVMIGDLDTRSGEALAESLPKGCVVGQQLDMYSGQTSRDLTDCVQPCMGVQMRRHQLG